ncbi:hypothetical protein, partial [Aphanizomenon sp. UHCC 0183]|uniref:hypothetical protein n=1 Tax=Aphanizomenon sp. UHCC 0183 TaxID=2590028 RepID=UPI001C2C8F3A
EKVVCEGLTIKKILKNFLWCGPKSPLTIKDGQDAHPTKLGNLFFGVPLTQLQKVYKVLLLVSK